jgi:cation:H+ antiporter
LPEVFTAVSAVLIDAPNLAVGDLFGAGLGNMLTLALVDVAYRRKQVWQKAALEQALIANLAVILTGLAGLLIVVRYPFPSFHVGVGTFAIALIYLLRDARRVSTGRYAAPSQAT